MAAIVVENGGVFHSIGRAVRTLFADPRPVVIGLFFILIGLADTLVAEWVKTLPNWPFILTTVSAIVMAVFNGVHIRFHRSDLSTGRYGTVRKVVRRLRAGRAYNGREVSPITCILLALLSFIPGVSLAAAWIGTRAFRNAPRFYLSGLICKAFGFFFITVQVLAFIGFLLPKTPPIAAPSMDSVTNASSVLASALEMFRAGNITGSLAKLDRARQDLATPRWACDYLQGIIYLGTFKLGEAEAMLRRAQTQESERPEISYALGQALYLQDKPEEAVEALNQALEKDPTLTGVAKVRDLIQEIREPSPLFRGASFIVILLILFTIHEYAHAYSAFKFGDDTAKNAGRLTLNPIAHLDPLGSIILPAMLLIRQSGLVFGWAKPVPVNCQNFKHPEKDYMVVSFAGPGANLLMAMACFICLQLIALSMRIISPESLSLQLDKPFAGVAITGITGAQLYR